MSDIAFLDCPLHGLQPHADEHGAKVCEACDNSRVGDPPAFRALALNIPFYIHRCATHGEVLHRTKLNTCTQCYDTARQPRGKTAKDKSDRALARNEGKTSFTATCETHGETAHSVAHGKCLTCFTGTGATRKAVQPSPRAVARSAGDTKYVDWCDTHGAAYHSVMHGKCLGCFTTAGVKRVFQPRERIA